MSRQPLTGDQTERPWEPSPELGRQTRVPEPVQAQHHPRPPPHPHTRPLWTKSARWGHRPSSWRQADSAPCLPDPLPSSHTKWGAGLPMPLPRPGPTAPQPAHTWSRPSHSRLLVRQARVGLCGAGHCGVRGAAPQSPEPRRCDSGLLHPQGWLPAAHWKLQALCASASRDPSPDPRPDPSRAPRGPLPARSRSSLPRSCAPTVCGELGVLGQARGVSAGGAAGLQEMPEDGSQRIWGGRGGGGEERAAAKPGRDRPHWSGCQGPQSPRALCLSWAPLPGTLWGSCYLRRSFRGWTEYAPENGQEAGRGEEVASGISL